MRRKEMKKQFDEGGIEAVEVGWEAAWEREAKKVKTDSDMPAAPKESSTHRRVSRKGVGK